MGRLQQRLVTVVVALGILTGVSVLVADLAAPGDVLESTSAPAQREDDIRLANATIPTPVSPPSG